MGKLVLLYVVSGLTALLFAGVNPAIVLSRILYHEDIREKGSGNPGFTNFKRVYGMKTAWMVMALDLLKCILLLLIFGQLFGKYQADNGLEYNLKIIGIAYVTLMASLGHDFPIWYGFKGGKGFLVNMAALWFLDWRAGLAGFIILCIFLFTVKYMSLATMLAILCGPVVLLLTKAEPVAIVLETVSWVLLVWRHKENIKRLVKGEERKFSFGKNK